LDAVADAIDSTISTDAADTGDTSIANGSKDAGSDATKDATPDAIGADTKVDASAEAADRRQRRGGYGRRGGRQFERRVRLPRRRRILRFSAHGALPRRARVVPVASSSRGSRPSRLIGFFARRDRRFTGGG
jgi:hypothetical protein